MRSLIVSATFAAFFLAPAVIGCAPARAQDFSITNELPADASRRDLLRRLQAWWDTHAYYPRRASNNDEAGTAKVHLVIHSDGVIWMSNVVEGSGSRSLDDAAARAFRDGFVRPFPPGVPGTELDVSVHYVLAFRRDQPMPAGYMPAASGRPFTITNEPVQSPILQTMLQKSCTGTVVRRGIRNHPWYGQRNQVEAVFFRRPDNTAWVRFYDNSVGYSLAPVVEIGKVLRWTGPEEHLGNGNVAFTEYTAWAEGANLIIGNIETNYFGPSRAGMPINRGGTVDFTCATQTVPAITWTALSVTPGQSPPGDPP